MKKKMSTIKDEGHENALDRKKAKFVDVTNELYQRLKNEVVPWGLILDQLQGLVEGSVGKLKIANGRLKLWGKPIGFDYWKNFSPELFLKSNYIKSNNKLSEKNLLELFESESSEKLFYLALCPYRMNDAEGRILKEAREQGIDPSINLRLAHIYDRFFRSVGFTSEIFNKSGDNIFYLCDKNKCYWMFNIYICNNKWYYSVEKAFEGRFGKESPKFANAWIWLSDNN